MSAAFQPVRDLVRDPTPLRRVTHRRVRFNLSGVSYETPLGLGRERDGLAHPVSTCPGSLTRPHSSIRSHGSPLGFNLSGISHETPPRASCGCATSRPSCFNLSGISYETPLVQISGRRALFREEVSTCPGSLTRPHLIRSRTKSALATKVSTCPGSLTRPHLPEGAVIDITSLLFQPVRDLSRDPTFAALMNFSRTSCFNLSGISHETPLLSPALILE